MRRSLPLLLIAVCGCAGHVLAATDDRVDFESLDGNKDGFISRNEVPADHGLARAFPDHDVDGDGQLSRAEFEAFLSAGDTPAREEF